MTHEIDFLGHPLTFHALLFNIPCFEHSILFKVSDPCKKFDTIKCKLSQRTEIQTRLQARASFSHDVDPHPYDRSNYELFKRSNFCICLYRLVLPRLLAPDLPYTSSSSSLLNNFHSDYKPIGFISLCIVTTSSFRHWVICVPAAFLKSGSRFSGSLSGIKP